jgi:hypothetical protein
MAYRDACEKERTLGRPKHRWEDNIIMNLEEIGWSVRECIDLAQDSDERRIPVKMVMNFRVQYSVGKFSSI